MKREFHLYIIDLDPGRAALLKEELASLEAVTVVPSYADAVAASGGLDATFIPLMSAMEWGAIKPPAPLCTTEVLGTPKYEVERGLPRYVIPGVAIRREDELNPIETSRLILRESFRAIERFNQASTVKLKSIGAVYSSLGFDKLGLGEAFSLHSEASVL